MSAPAQVPSRAIDPSDEATRYLAAAVNLDDNLADRFVAEFLAEPKRVIPPSPGVRAEPVLREAAGAQARRRFVSVLMLANLVVVGFMAPVVLVGWLAQALAWRIAGVIVTVLDRLSDSSITVSPVSDGQVVVAKGRQVARKIGSPQWWMVLLLSQAIALPLSILVGMAAAGGSQDDSTSDAGSSLNSMLGNSLPWMLVALAIPVVHAVIRWHTATSHFRYGRYQPDAPVRSFVAWACRRYAVRLAHILAEDSRNRGATGDTVVVYRGHDPFVGSGKSVRTWSMSLKLRAAKRMAGEDPSVPTFKPEELQDYVKQDLLALRAAKNLTPGWRFQGLQVAHWALLSSEHVLQFGGPLLAQLDSGVRPELTDQQWLELANSSPEWLRYFRSYRLEGWDRQLAICGYLHVGCEERTLFLEWKGYVLPPVATRHRTVDDRPASLLMRGVLNAIGEYYLLPTTIPARLADLARAIGAMLASGRGSAPNPRTAAAMYGSELSLRELAAGDQFDSYFQESDSDQYLKILDSRVLDAVRRFLAAKGISIEEFDARANQINNYSLINHGSMSVGNIGGTGGTGTSEGGDGESGDAEAA